MLGYTLLPFNSNFIQNTIGSKALLDLWSNFINSFLGARQLGPGRLFLSCSWPQIRKVNEALETLEAGKILI